MTYTPGKLSEFDLIISCGDLSPSYLEFLVTMARCPLLYVHGNHDELYDTRPPEGCICIDDRIYVHNGVRILGLGGSHRYRDGKYMFSEGQMRHINDFDSASHCGFECFNKLIERCHPRYFIHGHIHKNYGVKIPKRTQLGGTTVINAFEYCVIEI